jgi:hypothetical protein
MMKLQPYRNVIGAGAGLRQAAPCTDEMQISDTPRDDCDSGNNQLAART